LPDIGNNTVSNNIISNNAFEGVRIHQDSIIFSGNYVLNNYIGLTLKLTEGTLISGNVFSNNSSYAIQITDSASNNLVTQNNISKNGGGILISSENNKPALNNSFLNNTLYQDHGTSFLIESAPQGPIHFNNIYQNGDTNSFINRTRLLIEAENNWWGTTSTASIDSMIYDKLDDPLLGLVQYHLFLGQSDTTAPIIPPRNVVKRQVGQDVLVSWDPVMVNDLSGYYVQYGAFDGFSFSHKINAGNVTSFLLHSHSVFDSIAISAFDTQADGLNDQAEGHESEYVFALLHPYAGPDTTICVNSSLSLANATAFNYELINWTTTGDGTFVAPHILRTTYNPGPLDYQNRHVFLTLNVSGVGFSLHDQLKLNFSDPPVAFAGNDTLVLSDTVFRTTTAIAGNSGKIKWVTSGDGTFDNDTLLVTSYRPGMLDIANGMFVLTLHSISLCGSMSDAVEVTVLQSCSVNGRVHAGNQLAGGSLLQIYGIKNNKVSPVRSTLTTTYGNFTLEHIAAGDYYIYVIPDKNTFPGFAPSYYYDKLHWKDAYTLSVAKNTYDIDINLQKLAMDLPIGGGSISGQCIASGTGGQLCGNIVVMLYDKTAKYLLGWTLVNDDGTFSFVNLPFGDYLLVGEKAGYNRIFSQLISLSPAHPDVADAQLLIEQYKISFVIPSGTPGLARQIKAFPIPVKDIVYFNSLPASGFYRIIITGSNGKSSTSGVLYKTGEPCSMDMALMPAGLYMLRIYSGDVFLQTVKIIKL